MPSHRDWLLYRVSRETKEPAFYLEFQEEIERCRLFLRSSNAMNEIMKDIQIDLENKKAQVLLENDR